MTAQPRAATPPTPGARHELRQVAFVAALMGTPLMPWQRRLARLTTEHHPSGVGWRYPTVVLTVPRQSGKTTFLGVLQVQRCLTRPRHQAWATAQTGKDARERWLETADLWTTGPAAWRALMTPTLRAGDVRKGINRGAGSSAISWANGSRMSPFAPLPTSLDGYKVDCLIVDEAMSLTLEDGEDLLGSINPTLITRPWRQRWIVSTRGTAASTFFQDHLDRAQHSLATGGDIALLDYSTPDGLDLYAEATLAAHHPAFGHTITWEALQSEMAGPASVWERAYHNRQVAMAADTVVPLDLWARQALDPDTAPTVAPWSRVVVALDVALDRSGASLTAGWQSDGRVITRVIRSEPGTAWIPSALAGVRGAIWADPTGPTLTVLDAIPGVQVHRLAPREYGAACQAWLDWTWSDRARHVDTPGLDDQLAVAVTRALAGCLALDPPRSRGPIDQVRGTAIAAWAATRTREDQVF